MMHNLSTLNQKLLKIRNNVYHISDDTCHSTVYTRNMTRRRPFLETFDLVNCSMEKVVKEVLKHE